MLILLAFLPLAARSIDPGKTGVGIRRKKRTDTSNDAGGLTT
ncbi:hypothetical protein [Saltatorellus ferox]